MHRRLPKRMPWGAAVSVALCLWFGCATAGASWEDLPAFAWSDTHFSPATMGLAVGATAPECGGRVWQGERTLLVVTRSGFDQKLLPILADWAELDSLDVLIAPDPCDSASTARLRTLAGGDIEILGSNEARSFYACFGVGELVPAIAFLIDEHEQIVHRQTRLSLRSASELEPAVLAFASGNPLPETTIPEHLLARGEQAPWPDFELETPDGETVSLDAGPIRFLLSGKYVEGQQGAIVFDALDVLRGEYPQVEFVWHLPYVDAAGHEGIARMAERANNLSWDLLWGNRPVDEYLAESLDLLAVWRNDISSYAETIAAGWTVALDPGYRLQRWWLIYGAPTVLILDGDGTVLFPCSFLLADHRTGEPVLHPGALDALREVLDEAIERGGDDEP